MMTKETQNLEMFACGSEEGSPGFKKSKNHMTGESGTIN